MSEPARQRRSELRLQPLGDVEEGRRARAPVQELVAAADRQVRLRRAEPDRHGAGAVAEVPERKRAAGVGGAGEGRHVERLPALVVDVGEQQHADARVQGAREFGPAHRADFHAGKHGGEPLRHVEVGREVAGLGQDHRTARRRLQGGGEELEEVDRGGVCDQHLVVRRADKARDLGAEPDGLVDPVRRRPAPDQALTPLLLDHPGEARRGGLGQGAQRVAVQVDHVRRKLEARAKAAQRIGGVARLRRLLAGRHQRLTPEDRSGQVGGRGRVQGRPG